MYSDGCEENLKKIFQDKDFEENLTWLKYQKNWPLIYHLSPERKNLFSWINLGDAPVKILELGAGCGAITSYLITIENIEKITAVEGSSKRAELIKLRCKESKKLEVITSNIQDYNTEEKYDFVTLIGVLEYSGKYINPPDPFLSLIKYASKFLKTGGSLILAIENQLGHKYLAGCKEDHYGIPFEGISNYPNYNGFKTFDKNTLKKMLTKAGFSYQKWFYPFPDYKLPYLILNDKTFNNKEFDWLALLNLPTNDRSASQDIKTNERELLKLLIKNTDISCFMNSFLIFASKEDIKKISSPENLAIMLRTSKARKFHNIKKFHINKENKIIVYQKSLADNNEEIIPYYQGYQNLFNLILDSWNQKNYADTSKYLNLWLNILKSNIKKEFDADKFNAFFSEHLKINIYYREQEWTQGKNLDLIQNNCLLNLSTGDIKIIDLEWDLNIDIPIKLVIDRGMFYLLSKMKQFNKFKILKNSMEWNIPEEISKTIPLIMTIPDIKSLRYFEYWFQKFVNFGDFSIELTKEEIKNIDYVISRMKRKDTKLNNCIDGFKKILKKIRSKIKYYLKI